MVDCCGISWLRCVIFDLQYVYITILVCTMFASGHGQHMACYRLSYGHVSWLT